jgi:Luciferase-like monooxygenase
MTADERTGRVGVALHEAGVAGQLAGIELAERLGVPRVWLTTGGVGPDAVTLFAAAAQRTERIGLGTSIVPIYPRHPLALVQQALVVAALAPGRFRLGVGPSHRPSVEGMFGLPFERPLEYLAEYVTILKGALQRGPFDFEGRHFRVKGAVGSPPGVPVLISALQPASYRLAGYPRVPFYQRMFARAGYPEARDGVLSEAMMDAVVVHGDEGAAGAGLRAYLEAGMDELCASILVVGETAEARRASLERALQLVGTL